MGDLHRFEETSNKASTVASGILGIAKDTASEVAGNTLSLVTRQENILDFAVNNLRTGYGNAVSLINIASEVITGKKTDIPSSRVLATNLGTAGVERPLLTAAHHIVAGYAPAAAEARAILENFGIGINESDNGVYLPANRLVAAITGSDAAVHSTLHTNEYYRTVNSLLSGATNQNEARAVLTEIRNSLLSGEF